MSILVSIPKAAADFDPAKLLVPATKLANAKTLCATVSKTWFPCSLQNDATDSDIADLCVIEFAQGIGPDFFGGSPYKFDRNTVTTSEVADPLIVNGVLKEPSDLSMRPAEIGFCELEFTDAGAIPSYLLFRKAVSKFLNPLFRSLSGISGAPVFDLTKNALCGMVMRGTMNSSHECTIRYADIFDVIKFIDSALSGGSMVDYIKPVVLSELPLGLNLELKNAICSW